MSTPGPKTYPLHIVRYAAGQFLANAAYHLAKNFTPSLDVMHVAGSDTTGHHIEFKTYQVKSFELKKGMYGYLLLPEDRNLKDVKVIFRGTNFSDLKSVAINLETWGPGTASFETEKEKIFKTLKESIVEHYGEHCSNLTLEVCGHSQGAALSQLFVSEFLKRRAYNHEFEFVKALRMNVFNSPGVPHSTAQEATDATNVQWYVKRPIDIEANYCMVGGDAVQTAGNNSIFANLPPFLAKVNLLKIDIGMEGAWLKEIKCSDGLQPIEIWDALSNAFVATLGAHSSVKFYDPSKKDIHIGFKSEYYTNQKEEDRPIIAKELLNKALLLQYMLFFLKPIGHHVLDNKETYQELCCNRSYINSIYQKISGWFKRHADEIAKKDAQATQSLTLNH